MANAILGKSRLHKDVILFGTVDTEAAIDLKDGTGGETSLSSIKVCVCTPLSATTSTVTASVTLNTSVTFSLNGVKSAYWIAIGK